MNAEPFYVMCGIHRVSVVTHADYRVLEEERARFERLADSNYRMYQAVKEELAALRAREVK